MRWLLWLAVLWTALATVPLAAQGRTELSKQASSQAGPASGSELIKTTERTLELAQRNAILEAKAELADEAYSRLEILIGAFGAVITVVVLFFAIRTKNEAIAEARNAAADVAKADAKVAIDAAKADFGQLLDQERTTVVEIEKQLGEAKQLVTTISGLRVDALKGKEAIEADAARLAELTARLQEESKSGAKPDLSDEDRAVLEQASEAAKDTAQNKWTATQFRAAISKARFVDKDLMRAAELAEDMARLHGKNAANFAHAMNTLGDVELQRGSKDKALLAYQSVIDQLSRVNTADLRRKRLWAMHHAGHALIDLGQSQNAENLLRQARDLSVELDGSEMWDSMPTRHILAVAMLDQGRAADAEAELSAILPLIETVRGSKSSGTLTTRHVLAFAKLSQGRAVEAEADLVSILRLRKKVDGPESSNTLVTTYCLAQAILEVGNAAKAYKLLSGIPDISSHPDWTPRYAGRLAFVRGRVADALNRQDEAASHLIESRRIYSEHFPEGYYPRRQLEEYITQRGGIGA